MTSSIINWIVDKYLSNMLEINKEQTKSSLWSGEFEMSNLKIKPEIFTNMNLPYFELVHGYVGRMKISLSLPRFYLYPIKVEIDKVFFHAKQKKLETIQKSTEIANMEQYKNNQLQSQEELANEINNLQSEGQPGMMSQIINNLEIIINDICIRFDDDLSYDLIPFSFGLLLKNIHINTVDKNFQMSKDGETIPFSEINNKIIEMTNLSMYLDTYENQNKLVGYYNYIVNAPESQVTDEKLKDFLGPLDEYYRYCLSEINKNIFNKNSHQYLAFNLGFKIKLSMNENLNNGKPQYELNCELNKIDMSISLVQIKASMKLLAYQDLNSKYQLGLSKEFYTKKISKEERRNYIENYISYFYYKYGAEKNEPQAALLKESLTSVENGLTYSEIQKMRDDAKYSMKHDKEIDEIEKKIEELKGGTGFFSYFSSGPSKEQLKEIEKLEQKKMELINEKDEETKARLKKEQFLKNNTLIDELDDSFCLYKANFVLPELNFDINRQGNEKMLSMIFNNFKVVGEIRKQGQFFSLSIGDISMKQYQLKNTVYSTLIASIEEKNNYFGDDSNEGAFHIEYENNPAYEKSNFRFKFRNSKRLIITINLYSIQYIINKVLDSLATTISKFGSERYIGTGEIQNLIKSGFETNYISGGYQHFNINLDIEMKSPIIIYPQDILDKYNNNCLFIRCGDLSMKSILPPRQNLEVDYKKIKERNKLFDIYVANLQKFSMATLEGFDGDLSKLLYIKGLNLVDDIQVEFRYEQLFESENYFFEKMKVVFNIGKCKFNLRDIQLIFFIDLLKDMSKMNKQLEYDLEHKTVLEQKEDKQNKEDELKEKEEKEKKEKERKELEEKKNKNKKIEEKNKKINKKIDIDSDSLIIEFNLENIELCLMKSISKKERKILKNRNNLINDNNKDNEYRDFIVFQMNQFEIYYLSKEKGDMYVDISMLSTLVKDKETLITEKSDNTGDPLINPDFQELIQMKSTFSDKKIDKNDKKRKNRNIYNNEDMPFEIEQPEENEEKKDDKNKHKFMLINYKKDNKTNHQTVKILLQKIQICFSMNVMARLYQYYSYYWGLYCKSCDDSIIMLADMEEEFKKQKLKERLNYISKENIINESNSSSTINNSYYDDDNDWDDISEILEEDKQSKKLFGKKFIENLKTDLNSIRLGKKFKKILANRVMDKKAEEKIKNKKEELKKIIKTNNVKSSMDVILDMKETILDFPLEDTKTKTKLLRFKFNLVTSYKTNNEYNESVDGNGKTIKMEYIADNMKISCKILNIGFNIINYSNNLINTNENLYNNLNNYNNNEIIQGFRFQTNIDSFLLLPYREKSVMAINVIFEPLIFCIGFRQTKIILIFLPKLSQFLTDMYSDYDDPLKELLNSNNDNNNSINLINFENSDIIDNSINNSALISNKSIIEGDINKKLIENKEKIENYKIKELEKKKLKEKKDKIKEERESNKIINNTDGINYMKDIKVVFDKISIKFLDDSSNYLIPLLNIQASQTIYKLIFNSDTDSVENISNLVLESISRKEVPLEYYDINGLSTYMELIFNITIDYYNDHLNIWEPIIEQYNGVLKYDQVTPFSRTRMIFYSDDFFNMNVSITSMNVLNRFLKKYKENEEKWEIENQNKMNQNINDTVAVEFLNLSGMDIDCWFDAEKSLQKDKNSEMYKFTLEGESRRKKEINKLYLNSLYRQLSEAQIKIKKDKFSFKIKGYMPVYNNDFSTNYSTSFRIKKEDKIMDELKTYLQKQKEKNSLNNSKNKNKANNNEIEVKINQVNDTKKNSIKKELLKEEEHPYMATENVNIKSLNDSAREQFDEMNDDDGKNHNDDIIEIMIKIRQKGTLKSVVFISNIFIYNNLQIPICLSLVSERQLIEKYHLNEEKINFQDNMNNIIINTGQKRSIPLQFLLQRYRIYISFHNKSNEEQNKYSLLFKDFDNLRDNINEFIKYDEEKNLKIEEEKDEQEKEIKLIDNYSQLINIQKSKKDFYISSNLIIQRGKNDIIKEFSSEINDITHLDKEKNEIDNLIEANKFNFYCKTYFYLFILDESLLIENQIPCNMRFNITGKTKKEVTIRPLQKKEFLDVNQEDSNLKLSLNYHDSQYDSNVISIKSLEEKNPNENIDTSIKLRNINEENSDEDNKYIECNLKIEERFSNKNMFNAYEREYEHCLYSFQKKKKLLFYSKCIIINRTENLFYLQGEEDKTKNNYKILPLSLNLVNNQNTKQAFKIKSEKSSWSDKFNINTVGNIGATSLDIQNDSQTEVLDITIGIQTSWYFTNSLLITIEPRFILVNKVGFDMEYKQYNNRMSKDENEKMYKKQFIKNDENIKLTLIKEKKAKKMIQIKFNESKFFSCPFDLEEMGEIDLKIQINEEIKSMIEAKNIKIEKQIEEMKKKEEEKKIKEEKEKEKEQNKDEENNINNINNDKKELSPEEERRQKEEKEKEKIEKIKIKPRKYIIFEQNNEFYLLLHATKASSNGLIYIIIYPPKNPKYILENQSKERLTIAQKKDSYSEEIIILEKNTSIPYVWGDTLQNEQLLIISFKGEFKTEINLNQIKIYKEEFIDKNDKNKKYIFYFQTIVENNSTRKLIIKNEDIQSKTRGYFLKELKGQNKLINTKMKIDIKGIGLSVISNEPKEIFYISFYGNIIDYQIISYKKDECEHSITNIGLVIKNFQIDYCLKDNFKSMIIPLKQITPQIEENLKKGEEIVPLMQGIISMHNAINPLTQVSSDEFPQLDITLQKIKINISQYQLMSLISLYNEIMPELDFWTTSPEEIKEYNSIEDLQESLFGKKANIKDELIYDPEHYDKNLIISLKTLPEELVSNSENNWMFFIKYISLGAMDFIVSTRIDINSFGEFLPGIFMGILSAVGNVFTHITDYHIKLTSLLYTDVFTDISNLSNQLKNEYMYQVKRRIFKILGNLDILGNPTNYARSIGEGFLQLVEEPRKGLINGPLGFGEGIARGFGNFITTIITSTLDIVSKISGTLLSSLEVLQGNKALEHIDEREPETIFDGIYKGFKEGIKDIGKGIGGIFLKPYEQSQKKGIKGFFRGLGSGVLGLVISPFAATFRITSNILSGIKNTVNMFNPKIKTERFRYPRVIDKSGLDYYKEDKAIIKAILDYLEDYDDQEIIYYSEFTNVTRGLEEKKLILVLTNKCVMSIYKAKEVWFEENLEDIDKIEVHKEGNYFDLIFYLKDGKNDYIRTKDLNICIEFYLMFEKNRE